MSLAISSILTAKLADFAVRVAIRLGLKVHKGHCHKTAEQYRKDVEAADAKK